VVSLVLLTAVGASGGNSKSTLAITPPPDFTVAQVSAPSGADWLTHNGNIQAWRYSTLTQINASNGANLKLAWSTHLPDPTVREQLAPSNESPIVYKGIVYVQDGWMRITAMDGVSGKILWQFDPGITLDQGGGSSSGGTARSIGMGGGMIYEGAYGSVYALDAKTGTQKWATQVVDPVGGANIDVSPLYYKGLVIFGTSGGDSGASCMAVALDAKTGKVKWHYTTVPSNAKAFGWNTWPSQRWYYGGGAIWDPPSIDPTLDMVYYGTGQPLPFNGLVNGPGALTGTNGVYGLNALTGKFVWWFQEVHHDIWDYDGPITPTVVTITHNGKKIHAVDHMNKSGYNYVLDAKTGKPILGVVETPVPQEPLAHTYPTQPIPKGDVLFPRQVVDPQSYQGVLAPDGKPYKIGDGIFTPYTDQQYVVMTPIATGNVNWPEPAYDPNTGVIIWCGNYASQGFEAPPAADQHPVIKTLGFGNMTQLRSSSPPSAQSFSRLVAVNPATNKMVWKHDDDTTGGIAAGKSASCASTVTTTGSGLALIGRTVRTAQYPNGVGMIQAYSTKDGSGPLWQIPTLVNGQAVPIVPRLTPYSVAGKEYIVVYSHFTTAGPDVSAYALP